MPYCSQPAIIRFESLSNVEGDGKPCVTPQLTLARSPSAASTNVQPWRIRLSSGLVCSGCWSSCLAKLLLDLMHAACFARLHAASRT